MSVCFEITTKDGKKHIGAVQGSGGTLGAEAAPSRKGAAAAKSLQRAIWYLNELGRLPNDVCEPAPGCCLLIPPGADALLYEEKVRALQVVPLKGATFEVVLG